MIFVDINNFITGRALRLPFINGDGSGFATDIAYNRGAGYGCGRILEEYDSDYGYGEGHTSDKHNYYGYGSGSADGFCSDTGIYEDDNYDSL
jgi:hypothetical protein